MLRLAQGETDDIDLWALTATGAGDTGETVTLKIRRNDTGQYWNGATWAASGTVTMSEVSAAQSPGLYRYALTAPLADTMLVYFATTSSTTIKNFPQAGAALVGSDPVIGGDLAVESETLEETLLRLGLSQLPEEIRRLHIQQETMFQEIRRNLIYKR